MPRLKNVLVYKIVKEIGIDAGNVSIPYWMRTVRAEGNNFLTLAGVKQLNWDEVIGWVERGD